MDKISKIFILFFAVGLLLAATLFFIFQKRQPFEIVRGADSVPMFVKQVVSNLNGMPEFKDKHYKIYAVGFDDKQVVVPHLAKYDEQAILWLGGSLKINLEGIDKFKIILTSNPFNEMKITTQGRRAFFVPLGYDKEGTLHRGKDWVLIGQLPSIERILQQKKLKYRQYSWEEVQKNPQIVDGAFAVAVTDPLLLNKQVRIPEVIFEVINAGIPVMSYWFGGHSTFNWFNDNIDFYVTKKDATQMVDDIMSDDKIVSQRIEKNKIFTKKYFDAVKVSQQIAEIINTGHVLREQIKPMTMKIGIHTKVGQYGSGDYWLARYMKDFFESKDYQTDISFGNSQFIEPAEVYVRLRGDILRQDLEPLAQLNIWYQIYFHRKTLEQYLADVPMIMKNNDVFITASESIAEKVKKMGYESHYLPQFVDTSKFYRDVDERLNSEVLFVGNYHFRREGVLWAYQQGLPLTIYGDFYPEGFAKQKYIDNRILRKYYSSAKIVLNDAVPAMRENGFISNRIFDVTACKTLVISDYMPEIEKIYGDSVPMYKTKEELVQLVKYYLEHDKEREMLAQKAYEITMKNFTSDKILPELYQIIKKAKERKGLR